MTCILVRLHVGVCEREMRYNKLISISIFLQVHEKNNEIVQGLLQHDILECKFIEAGTMFTLFSTLLNITLTLHNN